MPPIEDLVERREELEDVEIVDNEPWGYYIYSVVKQGLINLAFERRGHPKAKFIGLSSADPDRYGLRSATRTSAGPGSRSSTAGSRRRPGGTRSSGCSRPVSSTSSTRWPTTTSAT